MKSVFTEKIRLGILLFVCASVSLNLPAQNINISNGFVFDGEPYLAINPINSLHMVAAWMGWILGSAISIKTRVTFDGGLSWSGVVALPHATPGFTSADPSIDFDGSGNVFLAYVDYNAATLNGAVFCVKSPDGGLSWNAPVEVINAADDGSQKPVDRPWIAVDRSGGVNDGNIYITTMNPNVFGPVPPPYNPYFIRSTDGGTTFDPWRYLDTTGWLAGSAIPQPMPTNAVSSDGVFHAVYPSYVISQNIYPRFILASSNDGGSSIEYHTVFSGTTTFPDTLAKKGYLLRTDPSDANHLLFLYLGTDYGDGDVFIRESQDGGATWSLAVRVNDDPAGNNRMQDLAWADFDADGDLIVTWRDRRNGTDSTYMASTEIWAAFRRKDSGNFEPNFMLSDVNVLYDSILAQSGNDFMCVKLKNDTINAVWGDTRSGKLNIWFQRKALSGGAASIQLINSETMNQVSVFPNPGSSVLHIAGSGIWKVLVYDPTGKQVRSALGLGGVRACNIDICALDPGSYIFKIHTSEGVMTRTIVKN